jgi:hypothetical protein
MTCLSFDFEKTIGFGILMALDIKIRTNYEN